MISTEQIDRAESEMSGAAYDAFQKAHAAELALEYYTYPRNSYERRQYSPEKRVRLLTEYREADYLAESRAWITQLIRASKINRGIPHDAVCFFKDGDRWCCVNGDFLSLQESPAGFGDTFDEALSALQENRKTIA